MEMIVFKKRPLSIMVHLSQDEAWELIRSLVAQMQRNDPNVDRQESFDVASRYFSIAVTPDPIRHLKGGEGKRLFGGIRTLLTCFKWLKKHPKDVKFYESVSRVIEKDIAPIIKKIEALDKK